MKMTLEQIDKEIERLRALRDNMTEEKYDRVLYKVAWDYLEDGTEKVRIKRTNAKLNVLAGPNDRDFWYTDNYGFMRRGEIHASVKSALAVTITETQEELDKVTLRLASLKGALIDPDFWEVDEE